MGTKIQAWSERNASSPWLLTFSGIQGLLVFLHLLEAHVKKELNQGEHGCAYVCVCVCECLSVIREWPIISQINLFLSAQKKIENYSILGKTPQAYFHIKEKGSPNPYSQIPLHISSKENTSTSFSFSNSRKLPRYQRYQ